jgi:RNA recognition motif-containing protein
MSTKLYVGGLAWATTDQSLKEAFAKFGNVVSAKVMTERESGRSRGFGFVEFESAEEAQASIAGLNGTELDGRQITVNEARPMTERKPGGFGGNRGNGGGNRW